MNVEKIRAVEFPESKNLIYLNNAATGLVPSSAIKAMEEALKLLTRGNYWSYWYEKVKEVKNSFAKLIGATKEEIAILENTSTGINLVASMLNYEPASNIVLNDLEFPANFYPWLKRGVKVKILKNKKGKVSIQDYEKAIDDNTIIVPVSHVAYSNGFRQDIKALAEIAHKHNALLLVDAIQSLGALEVNVRNLDIDFLVTGCQKWLLSPPGTGFLWIKKERFEKLNSKLIGWLSVAKPEEYKLDLKLSKTASRYELGTPNILGYFGVFESLKLILKLGVKNIERRILDLTDILINLLKQKNLKLYTPLEKECRSGIVNFKIKNAKEIVKKLRKSLIIVSCRNNGIRVAPHFYNTEEELEKMMSYVHKICCFE